MWSPEAELSPDQTLSINEEGTYNNHLFRFRFLMSSNPLLDKEILVLDGGLGTTLEDKHNLTFDSSTPLWSSHLLLTDPDLLERVQHDFVNAGADILLTPTYQASYDGFANTTINGEKIDFYEEICQYLDLAVDISRHAFNNQPGLVALSLGAYGATMSPSQEYGGMYGGMCDETKLEHWHVARIAMYWASWDKVDLVAFETLPRIEEIRAVRTAANVNRNEAIFRPYWVTCVFPNDDERLPDGSSVKDVVKALFEERNWDDGVRMKTPWGVGINCTEVQKLSKLVEQFENAASELEVKLPRLVIVPNGSKGQKYDSKTQTWIGDRTEDVAWDEILWQVVQDAMKRGRWDGFVVGGCCKTGSEEIAKLRKQRDA